jgi:hypothetical protein
MIEQGYAHAVAEVLRARGISLAPGLSDAEVREVEGRYGFSFPPDLRLLLQTVLPVSPEFPDWRSAREEALREWLERPRNGVLFDVEHNDFWYPGWGPRPESLKAALEIARDRLASVPRLIPVYANRYLPAEPGEPGNPVFSIQQTDIIYYGMDLPSYLENEFGVTNPNPDPTPKTPRPVSFWSDLVT